MGRAISFAGWVAVAAAVRPAVTQADPPLPGAVSAPRAAVTQGISSSSASSSTSPPRRITGTELYPQRHDALPVAPSSAWSGPPQLVDRPDGESATPAGVADAQHYVREMQSETFPSHVAGGPRYYRHLGREMFQRWQPPRARPPSVAEAVVNNFIAPRAVSIAAATLTNGPLGSGRGIAAVESLQFAHPHSPVLQPANSASAIADATARTLRADVEIDQDEHGALVAVRLVRRSGDRDFDESAVRAAQQAAANAAPARMPGGWRSRWSFEVTISRDPLMVAAPTLPGEQPGMLLGWAEVTSDGEVHSPLRLHQRRRIRLLWSRRLDGR